MCVVMHVSWVWYEIDSPAAAATDAAQVDAISFSSHPFNSWSVMFISAKEVMFL